MPANDEQLDELYLSSLRELKWIVAAWCITACWVIGVCGIYGYSRNEPTETVLGMPWWAFWGVFVPWVVTAAFTCWFALAVMQDHPLEDAEQPESNDA